MFSGRLLNHMVLHRSGCCMKMLCICLIVLVSDSVWSQEAMTPKRFRELAESPADTETLCPELASIPFWKDATCSITMKYQDGKVFKEDCVQTARTVSGKYIVISMESKFYKATMHTIVGYDQKAQAIRQWGLFGDTLTEATLVVDSEKKVMASASTYGDGFMEISAGCWSDSEESDHALVYKDGVLFMTRDVTTKRVVASPTAR